MRFAGIINERERVLFRIVLINFCLAGNIVFEFIISFSEDARR